MQLRTAVFAAVRRSFPATGAHSTDFSASVKRWRENFVVFFFAKVFRSLCAICSMHALKHGVTKPLKTFLSHYWAGIAISFCVGILTPIAWQSLSALNTTNSVSLEDLEAELRQLEGQTLSLSSHIHDAKQRAYILTSFLLRCVTE